MGSSHHGEEGPDQDPSKLEEVFRKHRDSAMERMVPHVQLGKQDDFPQGAYGPEDEGALAIAIGHDTDNRKVRIEFGAPVAWLAFDADQARHIGRLLIEHASLAEQKGLTLGVAAALKQRKQAEEGR